MDTLGALALATEPPTDSLMHRSPVGRRFGLIDSNACVTLSFYAHFHCKHSAYYDLMFGFREPLITNIMWRNLLVQVKICFIL